MSTRPARFRPAAEVPSPCVSVCAVDPVGGYCLGCYRTLDEIAAWIHFDSAQRLAVWDATAARREADDAHR
ncbi:MAG: DUF1289 domain-containing protein [Acidobacteriota bacterium]